MLTPSGIRDLAHLRPRRDASRRYADRPQDETFLRLEGPKCERDERDCDQRRQPVFQLV